MKHILALALLAPPLASADPTPPAQTVALLAAIGDRVDIVRQRESVGSHMEPFVRKSFQVGSQALNYAVLRGLDRAIGEEEPETQRVLLQWTMPEAVYDKVSQARGPDRQAVVLDALVEHLRAMPQRQESARIEAVVPTYTYSQMKGMGSKLNGIGIYVQPLSKQSIDASDIEGGDIVLTEADGDYKTVNPRTGETAFSSTFVAPYMYFERLTFDAKTMALLKRQRFLDNTKYADPQSTALDVSQQMSFKETLAKLVESVERSAYKSVRQLTGEVKVTPPRPVSAPTP